MVTIAFKEAKNLIARMPLIDKIKLVRFLEKETWAHRMNPVFSNIDRRRKKYKISSKEIFEEIQEARREFHARRS